MKISAKNKAGEEGKRVDNRRKPKLYLAGPEVFLPKPQEHATVQRELCERYGFTALHPIDNGVDVGERSIEALVRPHAALKLYRTDLRSYLTALQSEDMQYAIKIYLGNIKYVYECDIVVANCNPFRGALMDDGTAYELGLGNGLGKPSYGYIETALPAVQNILQRYPCTVQADGIPVDQDGYLVVDDFGTAINLMMQCGMLLSGGRLIEGSFEDCLRAVRDDLDTGKLTLPAASN
jgi:nucleoside 2-deoxyribosyltransferase